MIKLEHVGACLIRFAGNDYLPGQIIEVDELNDGFKRLIAEGRLEVMEDRKATKKVIEEIESKKVKKKEPKTVDEAENGGEYK